jgi:hypothetical protein
MKFIHFAMRVGERGRVKRMEKDENKNKNTHQLEQINFLP